MFVPILAIGIFVVAHRAGWGYWSFVLGVGSYCLMVFLISVAIVGSLHFNCCPMFAQRILYYDWNAKFQAKIDAHRSILVTYPLAIYMEFQLDKEFEKGGFKHAQQQLLKRLEEIGGGLTSFVTELVAKREELKREAEKKALDAKLKQEEP